MTAATRHLRRGYTLVELLIALAVTSIGLSAAVAVAIGQQRALKATESRRVANSAGQDAFFEVERSLHRAAFGIDPRYAFDFSWFRCTGAQQISGVSGRPVCRDRVTSSGTTVSDNLVFVARSPYYRVDPIGTNGCTTQVGCPTGAAWLVTGASTGSTPTVTLTTRVGDVFAAGRSLVLVCSGGSTYTMATVKTRNVATSTVTTLSLYGTDTSNPFFENAFSNVCYSGSAIAYQIDRFQYFVRSFTSSNGAIPTTTPWLVLDTGLDLDNSGNDPWTTPDDNDLQPIAPYVEDLQVAYVLNRASGGTAPDASNATVAADWVVGNLPGQVEAPDPTASAPVYTTASTSNLWANLHQANIRAVRVSLGMRSEEPDMNQSRTWKGDPLPVLENEQRTLTNAQLGLYHRWPSRMTISLHNMLSKGMFDY